MFKIVRNILYRSSSDPVFDSNKHKLDIYIPTSTPAEQKTFPVIMYIHGGAWSGGDRRDEKPRTIGKCMARRGYVTCVISYRLTKMAKYDTMEVGCVLGFIALMWLLAGSHRSEKRVWMLMAVLTLLLFIYSELQTGPRTRRNRHPAQIQDCASAFDWIKRHIDRFSGNPHDVTVMGHSAGAHLATLLATDHSWLSCYGRDPYQDIHAIIAISGVYSHVRIGDSMLGLKIARAVFGARKSKWCHCFPMYHLQQHGSSKNKHHPPIFLLNCEWEVGLKAHAVDYFEELRRQGVPLKQVSYKRLDHFSIVDKWDGEHEAIVSEMDYFIRHLR